MTATSGGIIIGVSEAKMKFTFGADPEFILQDFRNRPKSAIEVIGRGKDNGIEIDGNHFFYDNVLAECTITPAKDADEAVDNTRKALVSMARLVSPYKITSLASAEFENKEMTHRAARESGCSEEFCAYSMKRVPTSRIKRIFKKSNVRTAGGHVHLGCGAGRDYESCIMTVRMLDLFLGTASILVDRRHESRIRRKLYGAAGRYRQPNHGIEYRTLGNFWMSSPTLVRLVFDICAEVNQMVEKGIHERFWSVNKELLESDDFWNECGDPSICHVCHGYDVGTLRRMFRVGRYRAFHIGREIVSIFSENMSKSVKSRVACLANKEFDLYKEWGLV